MRYRELLRFSSHAGGLPIAALTTDEHRSAALLLGADEAAARFPPGSSPPPQVIRAVRSHPVPAHARRLQQRLAMKRGLLGYERNSVEPMARARLAALGEEGPGPPRLLVRVDEFPRAGSHDWPDTVGEMMRLHRIMSDAGVPYLLAVTPRIVREFLTPSDPTVRGLRDDEVEALHALAADGVPVALHGLDHRTRDARPRHRSELCGLGLDELARRVDEGLAILREVDLEPRVFVPPFNRFDAEQYPILAERFDVVCGGPETVALLGFHPTPLWRGDAVYMPAYPPLYGRADQVVHGVDRLVARDPGVWAPVVLHMPWEADLGWTALERLAERMAPHARSWDEFLDVVTASREVAGAAPASPDAPIR